MIVIRKEGDKYLVVDTETGEVLGRCDTKQEARNRDFKVEKKEDKPKQKTRKK